LEEVLGWFEGPASEMCEVSRSGKWCTILLDEQLVIFSCSSTMIESYSDPTANED
jgi:hypothetical protein